MSRAGLELIKSFEGLRRKAARLPGGRHVLGYGHIRSAREGAEVDAADAEALLRYDLLPIEAAINDWALAPLNQNQFDALVSFAFNIGLSTFRRSEVLRRINEGDLLRAAAAMDAWRRIDLDGEPVIVDALVRRRAVEKALFLTPPEGQVPAPTAVLKPRIDAAAFASVPSSRPEMLETPLDGDTATVGRADEAEPAPEFMPEPETDPSPEPELALVITETLIVTTEPEADAEPELALVITETLILTEPEAEPELEPEPEAEPETELEPDLEAAPAWTREIGPESDAQSAPVDEADIPGELESAPESSAEFESEPPPEFEEELPVDFEPESAVEFEPESDADLPSEAIDGAAPETALDTMPENDPESPAGETPADELQSYVFDHDADEEEDESLSAAQAAAAAVAARLSEILAQDLSPDFDDDDDLAALAEDADADTADGVFLQAPPSPPEEAYAPSAFPDLDDDAIVAFAAETSDSELAFEPQTAGGPELQPFPEDLPLPAVIEPEEQADFDSAFVNDPELEDAVDAPAAGDPLAAAPLEASKHAGLVIVLVLGGLTLIVAALVNFARTPLAGAVAGGSGWTAILGILGVLVIAGVLWFVLVPPVEADTPDQDQAPKPDA